MIIAGLDFSALSSNLILPSPQWTLVKIWTLWSSLTEELTDWPIEWWRFTPFLLDLSHWSWVRFRGLWIDDGLQKISRISISTMIKSNVSSAVILTDKSIRRTSRRTNWISKWSDLNGPKSPSGRNGSLSLSLSLSLSQLEEVEDWP